MSYSISNVKADMEGALHGTTVNQITNIYGLFNRAAKDILADIDPAETKRQIPVSNAIYPNVYDYPCPADLKGDRVVDLLPQATGSIAVEEVQQVYNKDFELTKSEILLRPMFTTFWNTGVKTLKINLSPTPAISVNTATTVTGEGTWAATSEASGLTTNNLNFISGGSALQFTLSGAGPALSGYLENSTFNAVDLSQLVNQGALFAYVYIPANASVTNFTLRWGSSSANYNSLTVTTTQEGNAFSTGWNLLKFNWSDSSATGSPDNTAINYLRFTMTATGTSVTPILLNNITACLGALYNIEYYSKYLFRDASTGAFQETVTADTNLLNLDTDSYQIFFNKVMILASQQLQGLDAAYHDGPFFQSEYDKGVMRYIAKYKSELQKPQSNYYNQSTPGYSQYYGSRRFTM